MPAHDVEVVRRYFLPRPPAAMGPLHPQPGLLRLPQAEVHPPVLSTGVPAAHGQLLAHDAVAQINLDPGADRIPVATGLAPVPPVDQPARAATASTRAACTRSPICRPPRPRACACAAMSRVDTAWVAASTASRRWRGG